MTRRHFVQQSVAATAFALATVAIADVDARRLPAAVEKVKEANG